MVHTRDSSMGHTRASSLGNNSIRHERFTPHDGRREFSGGTFFPGEYTTVANDETEMSLEDVRKSTMDAAESRYKMYGDLYKQHLDKKEAETSSELPPKKMPRRRRKEPKPKRKKREHKPRRPKRKERTSKGRFRRFIAKVLGGNTENMDTPKKETKEKKVSKVKKIPDEENEDKNMDGKRRRTEEWVQSVDMEHGTDSDLAPWQGPEDQ
ncbi:hypothetical protein CkaCkLH20_03003 [Colletotrichum karsti]|uniref:Uncharacterized protein n=1 Tax=Colletotrichum karsti TaxID=1095194 RepID=A0A9P6IHY0_9PEZI|nr:uncharacterized protein CkaCkLH20_03003 [Colletotrichum karsti]KAF9879460.1 hypothetical protein CkaCkLH20_03003 [Colletotrichum karsti]